MQAASFGAVDLIDSILTILVRIPDLWIDGGGTDFSNGGDTAGDSGSDGLDDSATAHLFGPPVLSRSLGA